MKGLIFILLILFALMTMLIGQRIYEVDKEMNITRDIYNLTENIQVNYTCNQFKSNLSEYSKLNLTKINQVRINNLICYFADFYIKSAVEFGKYSIEFGYSHPQYDFRFYIKFILIVVIASFLVPLILPIIAVFYLIGLGIYKLIIKLKKKKEEKKLT